MSTSNSRNALAGSAREWLASLEPDEVEVINVSTPLGDVDGMIALIGTVVAALDTDGAVQLHWHADETGARACFHDHVDGVRSAMAEIQASLDTFAADPLSTLQALLGQAEEMPVSGPMRPGAVLEVPSMYNDGTGMYL